MNESMVKFETRLQSGSLVDEGLEDTDELE